MKLSTQNNTQFDYVTHIPHQLKKFYLGTYEFKLRAIENLHLPVYVGSALRGVFGRSFRRVTCTQKDQECKNCLLRTACIYMLVFETPGDNKNGDATRFQAPHCDLGLNLEFQLLIEKAGNVKRTACETSWYD